MKKIKHVVRSRPWDHSAIQRRLEVNSLEAGKSSGQAQLIAQADGRGRQSQEQ
jgi:hypothetical protein